MPFIKTKDGVDIFYKDWGSGQLSYSVTAGRSRPTTGIRKCCSSLTTGFALLPMIGEATAAQAKSPAVTIWIIMPTISPH